MTAEQKDPRPLINRRWKTGDDAAAAKWLASQLPPEFAPDPETLRSWRIGKNNSRKRASQFAAAYSAVQMRVKENGKRKAGPSQ